MLVTASGGEVVAHERVMRLQTQIQESGQDLGPAAFPVEHFFAPGMYAREMSIGAGMVVVGKIHRHSHINTLSKGRVRVFTESGGLTEYVAPCTWVSEPNIKRAIFADEDSVWTSYHATDSTDLDVIEQEMIIPEGDG